MSTTLLAGRADHGSDRGPGLFQRLYDDGSAVVTNLRISGRDRTPGSGLISLATGLLFLLALGLFAVSLNAQYLYVFHVKHQSAVSLVEAVSLDAGMAIFSLLALGLARAGKSARVERGLILGCAAGSALMNYAAANVLSPRSVAAYVVPPVFLAVVVDRVIAVVRRHVLGENEQSPWAAFGRIALYGLRLLAAPPSTISGARRALLQCTPLPAKAAPAAPQRKAIERAADKPEQRQARGHRVTVTGPSKTSVFLDLVTREHGPLAQIPLERVYAVSKELAEKVGLDAGSARTALRKSILGAQAGDES